MRESAIVAGLSLTSATIGLKGKRLFQLCYRDIENCVVTQHVSLNERVPRSAVKFKFPFQL